MRYLIDKKHKHLLWKDELFDVKNSTKHTFLLLKYAEVYKYSKTTLRLYIWSSRKLSQLLKKGLIYDVTALDEDFTMADAKVTNLPHLIALGAFKRRPNINGNWIKSREKILAHRIFPYRPVMFK